MNTLNAIIAEIGKALLRLKKAVSSLDFFKAFMRDMGWSLETIPPPIQSLSSRLAQLEQSLVQVLSGDPPLRDFTDLANSVQDLLTAIEELKNQSFDPSLMGANFAQEFPLQLLDYLLVEYLNWEHPKIGYILRTIGIIHISYIEETSNRNAYLRREILWEKIPDILSDPASVINESYSWGTEQFADLLVYQNVLDLMLALRLPAHLNVLDTAVAQKLENNVPTPGDSRRFAVVIPLYEAGADSGDLSVGLKLFGLPKDGTKLPGLALIPYANGEFEQETQLGAKLFFTLRSNINMKGGIGIKVRPDIDLEVIQGLDDPDTASSTSGSLLFSLINRDTGKVISLIESEDGSGLFYDALSLSAGLYLDAKEQYDLFLELNLEAGKVLIKTSEADRFIQKIIPEDGIKANFDLAVGISTTRGIYFRGSSGLEINIPTHVSPGPIHIQSLILNVGVQPNTRILPITIGANVKLDLGPLTAIVDNIGLRTEFSFPEGGGNLGPIELDIGFKPPSGIGLAINGGGFKGGGFLEFIEAEERYSGILQLEYKNFLTLTAIGLLTTRLPDDREGYSLLIIIQSEDFTPINLGFGFRLTGVGGFLGLNRTMKIEALQSGIWNNTLDDILFPNDPIDNAARLISDLEQVFPAEDGQFIFGPMAQISWGTPTLMTIEMALALEFPNRLALPGVLKAVLPSETNDLLRLQMNFLGVINFHKKQLSFDAGLYESKILGYSLTGDMALRFTWGDDPNLLVTAGGFNPNYQPPMNVPKLTRLTVKFIDEENLKLTLESYFAITSNTAQFGVKADLYAAYSKFSIKGDVGFDVLFQFNPFHFIGQIDAGVGLFIWGEPVMQVRVEGSLQGPTPWIVQGKAKFKIWVLSRSVPFSKTFGDDRNTALPDVAVLPLLKKALQNRQNWQGEQPTRSHCFVTVKDLSSITDVMVHPVGTLAISQKVVPLDKQIDKFGNVKPSDANQFKISDITVDSISFETEDIQEQFAPAQFEELSDSQRLARKSFEKMKGGVRLKGSDKIAASYAVTRDVEYEKIIIDRSGGRRVIGVFKEAFPAFTVLLRGNAAARLPFSHTNTAISPLAPEKVSVMQEDFAVVNCNDLTLFDEDSTAPSQAEAFSIMKTLIADRPELKHNIQVVPRYEVNSL